MLRRWLATMLFIMAAQGVAAEEGPSHEERLHYVRSVLGSNPHGIEERPVDTVFGTVNRSDTVWPVFVDGTELLSFAYDDEACEVASYSLGVGFFFYRDKACDGSVWKTFFSKLGWGFHEPYAQDQNSQTHYERHVRRMSLAVAAFRMLNNTFGEQEQRIAHAYVSKPAGQVLAENLEITKALRATEGRYSTLDFNLGPYALVRLANLAASSDSDAPVFCSDTVWSPEFLADGPGSDTGYTVRLYFKDCRGDTVLFQKTYWNQGERGRGAKIDDKRYRLVSIYASHMLLSLWDEIVNSGRALKE